MKQLELPALDGRLPLGFLAALGITRLLSEHADRPVTLAWSDRTGTPRLGGVEDIDQLLGLLERVVDDIPEVVRLPGGPPDFPGDEKPQDSPRGDPMRLLVGRFRHQLEKWRSDHGSDFVDTWIPAMVTDQIEDDAGCVAITPLAAPSGQQKFATMFRSSLQRIRKDPALLRQALVGWRRVDGSTGEYLDHHVLRSAADRSDGESKEAGVPGATWLALMAFPWFPVYGGRRSPLAAGWQTVGRRSYFVWPLWSEALDPDAIQVVLNHSSLQLIDTRKAGEKRHAADGPTVDATALAPYSVFAVGAAERQRISGRTFAGVLTPVEVTYRQGIATVDDRVRSMVI